MVVFSTIVIILFNLIVDCMLRRCWTPRIRLTPDGAARGRERPRTQFGTDDGVVQAVDGVSFAIERGKTLGIVGESGSEKSVTCLTVMGLNDPRNTTSEELGRLRGIELIGASKDSLNKLRGVGMAMIAQDPMTSLNPVKTIGWQLEEAFSRTVTRRARGACESGRGLEDVATRAPSSESATTLTSSRVACASG